MKRMSVHAMFMSLASAPAPVVQAEEPVVPAAITPKPRRAAGGRTRPAATEAVVVAPVAAPPAEVFTREESSVDAILDEGDSAPARTVVEINDLARRASVHMGALRVGRKLPVPPRAAAVSTAAVVAAARAPVTPSRPSVTPRKMATTASRVLGATATTPALPAMDGDNAFMAQWLQEEEMRLQAQLDIALGLASANPEVQPRPHEKVRVPLASATKYKMMATPKSHKPVRSVSFADDMDDDADNSGAYGTAPPPLPPMLLLPPSTAGSEGEFSLELQEIYEHGASADSPGGPERVGCCFDDMCCHQATGRPAAFRPVSPQVAKSTASISMTGILQTRLHAADSTFGPAASPPLVAQRRSAFARIQRDHM